MKVIKAAEIGGATELGAAGGTAAVVVEGAATCEAEAAAVVAEAATEVGVAT